MTLLIILLLNKIFVGVNQLGDIVRKEQLVYLQDTDFGDFGDGGGNVLQVDRVRVVIVITYSCWLIFILVVIYSLIVSL